MKKIIGCFFVLIMLMAGAFAGVGNSLKQLGSKALNKVNEQFESLNTIINDSDKSNTTARLKKRIDDLKRKNPDKLRKELIEKDSDGETPLFYAVRIMDENLVNSMLSGLGNTVYSVINDANLESQSILMTALLSEYPVNYSIIEKLIQCGANCDAKISSGEYGVENGSVLMLALNTKNPAIIRLIISKVNKIDDVFLFREIVDDKEEVFIATPLYTLVSQSAKSNEYNDCIKALLDKGADPNHFAMVDDYQCTAMHIAAGYNNRTIYNLLKRYGGDSKLPDSNGKTAFDYISDFCETDADRLFLAYEEKENVSGIIETIIKSKINQIGTGDKKTALQIALSHNDSDSAIKLLNAGADIYIKDSENKTALDYALLNKTDDFIQACLNKKKPAKESMYSIIDYSLDKEDLEYVKKFFAIDSSKYLYEEKGTGSKHNYFTYTAASSHGDFDTRKALLEFLLQNGYSVNDSVTAGDDKGNTALMYAAQKGDSELVSYLLEKGADINLVNSGKYSGRSPIFFALEAEDEKTVNLLLSQKDVQKSFNKQLINKSDKNATFLMFLARYGSKAQMKKYLPVILKMDKNALTRKDTESLTPFLYAAAYNEDPEVMKILRMYGADVYVKAGPSNAADLAEQKNHNSDVIIERLNSYGVYSD